MLLVAVLPACNVVPLPPAAEATKLVAVSEKMLVLDGVGAGLCSGVLLVLELARVSRRSRRLAGALCMFKDFLW